MKGANAALGAYAIYEGVKRGAQEAGKEAAEGGDGAVKSTAKVVGYSAPIASLACERNRC